MAFVKANVVKIKPDKPGKIVVRVFLLDETKRDGMQPVIGNRREDFALEDTTVGEVAGVIHQALFGVD